MRFKARALSVVRRGREIAWAAPWMRLGNQLGLGNWAYEGRLSGRDRYVLRHDDSSALIDLFPVLCRDYLLLPGQVRFTDQRLMPWSGNSSDRPEWSIMDDYIRNVLWPGSPLARMGRVDADAIVVNVRRGDFYTVPSHRAEFGIPIEAYVAAAVDRAIADGGVPGQFLVVSDDIRWCRDRLSDHLGSIAPVEYRPQGDAAGDLATLIGARRLIIPNSTFSMWGGFIGDVIQDERAVYAPWMFSRAKNGGEGTGYRPTWTIIDDVEGGWDRISE